MPCCHPSLEQLVFAARPTDVSTASLSGFFSAYFPAVIALLQETAELILSHGEKVNDFQLSAFGETEAAFSIRSTRGSSRAQAQTAEELPCPVC